MIDHTDPKHILLLDEARGYSETASDDPHTKVGCIVVTATGYKLRGANRLPPGVVATPERLERPEKYLWIEHAERDVIGKAAAMGQRLAHATMYLPWYPCPECARMIVRAEIAELVCYEPTAEEFEDPKWKFNRSRAILEEGNVRIYYLERAEANAV